MKIIMHEPEKKWTWEEDGMTVVRSIARTGPGCQQGCGVLLYVKDGKLVKVEGDPEFPLTQGRLCPRCLALTEVVYHPDRLKHPLKRTGERGEGKWQRISWDEALDTTAERFNRIKKEYGAESVIFCQGTHRDIMPYHSKLTYSFGSPNKAAFGPLQGHACFEPRVRTMQVTTGAFEVADYSQFFPDRYENPEWRRPECIVIWGNEPTNSSPGGMLGYWVTDCMKMGSRLIVIDPRRTWAASRADIWLQIRPGTDSALALGMLNVIVNEDLYDKEFTEKWTHGFDELKKRVQDYPPEKVSEITWIPRDKIISAAKMYASSKPASVQWGVAIDQTKEAITTPHAILALWTLTGNMDVPGGNAIVTGPFSSKKADNGSKGESGKPGKKSAGAGGMYQDYDLLPEEQKKKKIGAGMFPFCDRSGYIPVIGAALEEQLISGEPYPVKAAWIQTTNTFACGAAAAKKIYDGFRKLDFVAVADLFMTPTAMAFADIVLPASTYAERDGIGESGMTLTGTINKAIEPVGECRSDMEINLELGRRLNPEAWPWKDVREMFDVMLEPHGIGFEKLRDKIYLYDHFEYRKYEKGLLRPDEKPGFNTPTGRVELYSTIMEECDLDPLPYFEEPPESPVSTPEIAKESPLVWTTGAKTRAFFHSEHRQIPSLRSMNPDPLTEIHP